VADEEKYVPGKWKAYLDSAAVRGLTALRTVKWLATVRQSLQTVQEQLAEMLLPQRAREWQTQSDAMEAIVADIDTDAAKVAGAIGKVTFGIRV